MKKWRRRLVTFPACRSLYVDREEISTYIIISVYYMVQSVLWSIGGRLSDSPHLFPRRVMRDGSYVISKSTCWMHWHKACWFALSIILSFRSLTPLQHCWEGWGLPFIIKSTHSDTSRITEEHESAVCVVTAAELEINKTMAKIAPRRIMAAIDMIWKLMYGTSSKLIDDTCELMGEYIGAGALVLFRIQSLHGCLPCKYHDFQQMLVHGTLLPWPTKIRNFFMSLTCW